MFELGVGLTVLLILCILCVCVFEFINGFHDTANAVATVIYTNSLPPTVAVVWAGICNFAGVFVGGIAVAMGVINLLPVEILVDQNVWHSVSMVLALLFTAIFWNLGTWYFGIPCSSSHTLIGSILGVGLAYQFVPDATEAAVNWSKAKDTGLTLLVSPLFGFLMAMTLMFILKKTVKQPVIFNTPDVTRNTPPWWIRSILILTSTGVSFSHGSNDGQKGVGLLMLVLIGIVPSYFAINIDKKPQDVLVSLSDIEQKVQAINEKAKIETEEMHKVSLSIASLKGKINRYVELQNADSNLAEPNPVSKNVHFVLTANSETPAVAKTVRPEDETIKFQIRKDILVLTRGLESQIKNNVWNLNEEEIKSLKNDIAQIKEFTDYAPWWALLLISLSLGLGTMIGWKRIAITIGEKIGKTHLTYAQGASSEMIAASTIALSTYAGLPVSTTHVLSSGIAGSMAAEGGLKNLQQKTITSILLAWVLTLPVCIVVSGSLFLLLRAIL